MEIKHGWQVDKLQPVIGLSSNFQISRAPNNDSSQQAKGLVSNNVKNEKQYFGLLKIIRRFNIIIRIHVMKRQHFHDKIIPSALKVRTIDRLCQSWVQPEQELGDYIGQEFRIGFGSGSQSYDQSQGKNSAMSNWVRFGPKVCKNIIW